MGLFNRKKKQEEPLQRPIGIIYNAFCYTLTDDAAAPQRKSVDLFVLDCNNDIILKPTQIITLGREEVFKKALESFKTSVFGLEPIPHDTNQIKEMLKRAAYWSYLTVL